MPEKHNRLLIRDAFFSTVFVFACIAIFALNPLNLKVFNMIGMGLKDIEFTDLVFSGKNANKGDIRVKISRDIVLVNAADRGRMEIAGLIHKINAEKPAVIGVDFIFEGPKGKLEDSLLKDAFSNVPRLVLATKFKNDTEDKKATYITTSRSLGEYREGYANLMITSQEKTVRYIRSGDRIGDRQIHPFALEVVKCFDSAKAEVFLKRNKLFELINYEGNLNSIYNFNGNDIENGRFPAGFLKDKIVLVGFFGSDCNPNPVLDDYFYTPMSEKILGKKLPDTYGVIIQANMVNMILKENYITKTSAWADWLIGFMICFLHNFIFIRHYVHKHLWYHFYAKIIQLVTTFILVLLFIYLFREFNIKVSASPFIIPILLTVDLLYFYDTLVKWMHKRYKTKTYFLTGPLHH